MEHREMRPDCDRRISALEDRVENIDESLYGNHGDIPILKTDNAVLKSEVCGLVKSVDRLTKGIWGMVAAVLTLIITMMIQRVFGG